MGWSISEKWERKVVELEEIEIPLNEHEEHRV